MAQNNRVEKLRRRIARAPDAGLFAQLAEEWRRRGNFVEAIRTAREGIERYPDDPGVRVSLGRALLESGDGVSARKEFETVLRAAPDNAAARSLLVESSFTVENEVCEPAREVESGFTVEGEDGEPAREPVNGNVYLEPLGFTFEEDFGEPASGPAADAATKPVSEPARAPVERPAPQRPPEPAGRPASSPAGPPPGAPTRTGRRLAPAAGRPESAIPDTSGAGSSRYVDFSDEGTVVPTKVSPIIESLSNPESAVGEALRLLGARVQKLREERQVGCLALTSPLPGDGKSALSLGLAAALAREPDQRVLLVEADLRRPSLVSTLGLPPSPGLNEWLGGSIDHVPLRLVEPGGFFILVAGQAALDRPELLGSPRMESLLQAARKLFDFVLLDTVPVMPVSDTVLIQEHIDGFLLVVRSRRTPREAVQDSLSRLRADKVLGVVLNDQDDHASSYRSSAYGSYGMVHHSRTERGGGLRRRRERQN